LYVNCLTMNFDRKGGGRKANTYETMRVPLRVPPRIDLLSRVRYVRYGSVAKQLVASSVASKSCLTGRERDLKSIRIGDVQARTKLSSLAKVDCRHVYDGFA